MTKKQEERIADLEAAIVLQREENDVLNATVAEALGMNDRAKEALAMLSDANDRLNVVIEQLQSENRASLRAIDELKALNGQYRAMLGLGDAAGVETPVVH